MIDKVVMLSTATSATVCTNEWGSSGSKRASQWRTGEISGTRLKSSAAAASRSRSAIWSHADGASGGRSAGTPTRLRFAATAMPNPSVMVAVPMMSRVSQRPVATQAQLKRGPPR